MDARTAESPVTLQQQSWLKRERASGRFYDRLAVADCRVPDRRHGAQRVAAAPRGRAGHPAFAAADCAAADRDPDARDRADGALFAQDGGAPRGAGWAGQRPASRPPRRPVLRPLRRSRRCWSRFSPRCCSRAASNSGFRTGRGACWKIPSRSRRSATTARPIGCRPKLSRPCTEHRRLPSADDDRRSAFPRSLRELQVLNRSLSEAIIFTYGTDKQIRTWPWSIPTTGRSRR